MRILVTLNWSDAEGGIRCASPALRASDVFKLGAVEHGFQWSLTELPSPPLFETSKHDCLYLQINLLAVIVLSLRKIFLINS